MKFLVIIDMQNDFLTGILGNEQTAEIVPAVCVKAKRFLAGRNAVMICTMDTHTENYLSTQEGRNLPIVHCIKGTYGWQLDSRLRAITENNAGNVYSIEKGTFAAEELPERIKEISRNYNEKIDEIELVGVCTDICVISNAILLKTFFPEVLITVDSSCCAGVTPESHNNAINAMKMCQINIAPSTKPCR